MDTVRYENINSIRWIAIAPVLALSVTLTTSILAGLILFFILIILSLVFSSFRWLVPHKIRLPVIILIVSTVIILMDMVLQYFFYEIRESFGIYLPVIAVNSLVFAISEDCFFREKLYISVRQALLTGTVFLMMFILIGIIREIVGYGTLFRDIGMLSDGLGWVPVLRLPADFTGISLIHSPPGALLICGLVAALIRSFVRVHIPGLIAYSR